MTRSSSDHSLHGDVVPASFFANTWTTAAEDDVEDLDKTTFRVHSKHGFRLWLTPLIFPAISRLLMDLRATVCVSLPMKMLLFNIRISSR